MRVLVACERSGTVRDAFRARGHDAWSNDLLPAEDDQTYHLMMDARDAIAARSWDLLIAHPPCTHLAISGARYFHLKRELQVEALDFVIDLLYAPVPHICIENPVSIISTMIRKPDQVIQPFQFGTPEAKRTCLWLSNLPKLTHTDVLPLPECGYWANQTPSGQNKYGEHHPDRAYHRARTYPTIAAAMATQWSNL